MDYDFILTKKGLTNRSSLKKCVFNSGTKIMINRQMQFLHLESFCFRNTNADISNFAEFATAVSGTQEDILT